MKVAVKYSVKINTNPQKVKYNKMGISCDLNNTIEVSADTLIASGSTLKIKCVCEKCNSNFERQARQIKERDAGDKYCTKCAISETSTGRLKSPECKLKMSISHKSVSFTDSHKRCISSSVKTSLKSRGASLKNLPEPKYGKDNTAYKEKTGFDLFKYQCQVVRNKTLKEHPMSYDKGDAIYYKISLKKAYQIGMDPSFVGSQLVVLPISEYNSVCSMGNTHGTMQKKNRRVTKFSSYRNKVQTLTNKLYEEYKDVINPNDLPRGKQSINNDNYHIDHIVPVNVCWDNGISAEVCASLENVTMLHWRDNISKNGRMTKEGEVILQQLLRKKEHTI